MHIHKTIQQQQCASCQTHTATVFHAAIAGGAGSKVSVAVLQAPGSLILLKLLASVWQLLLLTDELQAHHIAAAASHSPALPNMLLLPSVGHCCALHDLNMYKAHAEYFYSTLTTYRGVQLYSQVVCLGCCWVVHRKMDWHCEARVTRLVVKGKVLH